MQFLDSGSITPINSHLPDYSLSWSCTIGPDSQIFEQIQNSTGNKSNYDFVEGFTDHDLPCVMFM